MKSLALLAVLAVCSILPPSALAQGFRGGVTSTGNSRSPAPVGMATTQTRHGTTGSVTITSVPPAAVAPAPNVQIHSAPAAATQRHVPPVFHSGGVFVAPPNALRPPPVVVIETTRPPNHPHRRRPLL